MKYDFKSPVWDSKHKIGIEVEFYSANTPISPKNTIIGYDSSLDTGGHEIRFYNPTRLKDAPVIIQDIHDCLKNEKAEFISQKINYKKVDGFSYKKSKNHISGLHIHYNATDMTMFDRLRLLNLCVEHHETLIKLGRRKPNTFCEHPKLLIKQLFNNNRFVFTQKMYGIYLDTNHSTVEFRYGDASLITDLEALEKYIEFTKYLVDLATTGEHHAFVKDRLYYNAHGSFGEICVTEYNKKTDKEREMYFSAKYSTTS